MIDHDKKPPSLEDARAVATAFARVAADLCNDPYVRKMAEELRVGDLDAVERFMPPFRDDYRVNMPNIARNMDMRCSAAFTIEHAAQAAAQQDARKATLAAHTARQRCECLVQRLDFNVVDLSGPNHAASLAKVLTLAAQYVSPETIAAVLA